MEFDSLLLALQNGQVDAVIAGMTITDERKEAVDFSEPYYTATQVMIVRDDSDIKKASDMKDKKIVVVQGYTGETCVQDLGYSYEAFKKGSETILELTNGKCDVVVIDSATAEKYVADNQGIKIVEDPDAFAAEEYGCHVLVEKPILTDKSQVKAFKELLKKTNKVITTCHPRRFDAMFVRIKELVAEYRKKYGKVKYFEIRTESAVPTENERRNYHDSLLSDHLCHELDLMNYILGSEKVKTVERHWDGFDDYGFMGERADEARFFFRATKNLEKGAPCHIKMRIMFNMAELYVDNLGETYLSVHVRCYSNYYVTVKQLHAYRKKVKLPDSDHNAKYEALNRNFIDSILGKAEPYLSKDEILMAATLPLRYMRQRK